MEPAVERPPRRSIARALVAGSLLAAIVALAFWLRLAEPLSGPGLGAEDPYTHVVFTKEALERAEFGDSFYLGTSLYPPGIHAFLGAFAPLAGVSLVEAARFVPPFLGALAALTTFALARRLGGTAAGLVAALVVATAPEHIVRTNLLFPSAFDLALVPAWLLLFHVATEAARAGVRRWRDPGRLGAAALFLLMSAPLAFLHPWVVPLFAAPLGAYAMLRGARSRSSREARERVGWSVALLVPATAFAMASRWSESDTGFADFGAAIPGVAAFTALGLPPGATFGVLLVALGLASALAVPLAGLLAGAAPRPGRVASAFGAVLGVALVAGVAFLALGSLPRGVDYFDMLGPVAVTLGLAGVALACARPTKLGDLGLAVTLPFLPLTAINLFGGPFWAQRTVAYLCLGVALLAGAAALELARALRATVERVASARIAGPAAVVACVALVAGGLGVASADSWSWYRIYEGDQYDAVAETSAILAADPGARALVYSWQPALVLRSLGDLDQVRYAPRLYSDEAKREAVLDESGGRQLVVVDRFTLRAESEGKVDLAFLADGYSLVLQSDDRAFQLWEAPR